MILRNSTAWPSLGGALDDDERLALHNEDESRKHAAEDTVWRTLTSAVRHRSWHEFTEARSKGFWGEPKELRENVVTLCVAAIVQGWNQTATNGANLTFPSDLDLDPSGTPSNTCQPTGLATWRFAAINASPYLSASFMYVSHHRLQISMLRSCIEDAGFPIPSTKSSTDVVAPSPFPHGSHWLQASAVLVARIGGSY